MLRIRPKTLDRAAMAQLLGDRRFYADCPALAFLREEALAGYQLYMEQLRDQSCTGCAEQSLMFPSIRKLLAFLMETQQTEPQLYDVTREQIKQHVRTKVGYYPSPLTLYWREPKSKSLVRMDL